MDKLGPVCPVLATVRVPQRSYRNVEHSEFVFCIPVFIYVHGHWTSHERLWVRSWVFASNGPRSSWCTETVLEPAERSFVVTTTCFKSSCKWVNSFHIDVANIASLHWWKPVPDHLSLGCSSAVAITQRDYRNSIAMFQYNLTSFFPYVFSINTQDRKQSMINQTLCYCRRNMNNILAF